MSSKKQAQSEARGESGRPDPTAGMSAANSPNGRLDRLDGRVFKGMIWAAYVWLERHKETVNALNVFPVPDGDTGTNMYLTMRSAWKEIDASDDDDISHIAQAVAQGALMGARGNSGVILSQILRGLAHSFRQKANISAEDLVTGLRRASDTAYKGVVKPVEGTILTVIRESANAAQRAAAVDLDLKFVLDKVVQAAQEAVERTPLLLPVLAKAGVVDSGGKGLFYILEGMLRGLRGEELTENGPGEQPAKDQAGAALDPFNLPPIRFGFDVQFLIWGTNLDVDAIRKRIQEIGDYPLIEGSSTLVKIHVHVFDPSVPLAYGVSQGFITDVVVENMDAMAAAGGAAEDVKDELSTAPKRPLVDLVEPLEGVGVIAVAPGPGLREVFESLGVGAVVSGGQTMNPSTQELLEAIEALPSDEVILLPNNGNIILAAQQARQLAAERLPHKRVAVVPSRTVPQGISALLAFNLQADIEENAEAMTRALASIDTGEVTVAVRDASIDGVDVSAGDVIGLLNGALATKGKTSDEVALLLLVQMNAQETEIITVYYGESAPAEAAEALGEEIRSTYPDQDVEVISGGQPHYHYIISAE